MKLTVVISIPKTACIMKFLYLTTNILTLSIIFLHFNLSIYTSYLYVILRNSILTIKSIANDHHSNTQMQHLEEVL